MYGIICDEETDMSLFRNYKSALKSYLKIENFVDVTSTRDLNNLKYIFIIDEHFERNFNIWGKNDFINYLNEKQIRVIFFNFEKIYNSEFEWNIKKQEKVELIENRLQFVSDVDDLKKLGINTLTKQLLSIDSGISKYFTMKKKNRILFIGNKYKNFKGNNPYSRRKILIENLKKMNLPLDIKITNKKFIYSKFLETLASYKFILNPLGTGNFLNVRFYETLECGSIPIQQVTENMLNKYKELKYAITFFNSSDLKIKLREFQKMNYYLEDYFEEINLRKLIN